MESTAYSGSKSLAAGHSFGVKSKSPDRLLLLLLLLLQFSRIFHLAQLFATLTRALTLWPQLDAGT